jgi:hypothetical protein
MARHELVSLFARSTAILSTMAWAWAWAWLGESGGLFVIVAEQSPRRGRPIHGASQQIWSISRNGPAEDAVIPGVLMLGKVSLSQTPSTQAHADGAAPCLSLSGRALATFCFIASDCLFSDPSFRSRWTQPKLLTFRVKQSKPAHTPPSFPYPCTLHTQMAGRRSQAMALTSTTPGRLRPPSVGSASWGGAGFVAFNHPSIPGSLPAAAAAGYGHDSLK